MDRRTFLKGVAVVPIVGMADIAWEHLDVPIDQEWVQIELPFDYIQTTSNVILPSTDGLVQGTSGYIINTGEDNIQIKGSGRVYDGTSNLPRDAKYGFELEGGGMVSMIKYTDHWLLHGSGIT